MCSWFRTTWFIFCMVFKTCSISFQMWQSSIECTEDENSDSENNINTSLWKLILTWASNLWQPLTIARRPFIHTDWTIHIPSSIRQAWSWHSWFAASEPVSWTTIAEQRTWSEGCLRWGVWQQRCTEKHGSRTTVDRWQWRTVQHVIGCA